MPNIKVYELMRQRSLNLSSSAEKEDGAVISDYVFSELEKLKVHSQMYQRSLELIHQEQEYTTNKLEGKLISLLDEYKSQLLNNGEMDFPREALQNNRTFHYISEDIVSDIVDKEGGTCNFCHKESSQVFKFWHYPDWKTLCCHCISSGIAALKLGINFYWPGSYAGNSEVRYYQIYRLAHCTPRIKYFSQRYEMLDWARHCGDFALYTGYVAIEEVPETEVVDAAREQGVLADVVIESCETGGSWFHGFKCETCKKSLYKLDFFD